MAETNNFQLTVNKGDDEFQTLDTSGFSTPEDAVISYLRNSSDPKKANFEFFIEQNGEVSSMDASQLQTIRDKERQNK